MAIKVEKLRKSRRDRITNVVAPLVAEGATITRIQEVTGLSRKICWEDSLAAKEMFQDTYELDFETIRGELAAKHNMLFNFALQDYKKGAGTRALETAGKQLDSLARIYGVAGGISLHAHNHQGSITVTTEAVGDLFKPLDAGSYAEMVAAKALPPSEAQELPDVELEAEDLGTDDWGSAVTTPGVMEVDEPKAKKTARPYPFRN
ncbi:bacterial regulatory s/ tetR family protein [Synechococcus sp. MEDNS5]|uniref:hypothetical protein n=1 Tax=Synechococcus sp. MEDNS5 TaxID=1442554 RepID=UPI00164549F2|nr:hypothetical protein [Synechococcus sp. MEDNS5]QNJ06279.1 bacterial regulatory s/ tetR family protein [Synechococcus sp. MEDNS5]